MAKEVRTGKMGLTNLGRSPRGKSHPWSIYKAFKMDFAEGAFPGKQELWTSPRGGHQIRVADVAPNTWFHPDEIDSIFGYEHPDVIPDVRGDNAGKGGMFLGTGMNLYINDSYDNTNKSHNFVYQFGSKTAGNPIPIGGITFDMNQLDKAYKKEGNSTVAIESTSAGAKNDFQINEIYGCYLNPDNGTFISKKFAPEGDNWGGNGAGVNDKNKYTFRNTNAYGTPVTNLVRKSSDSHFVKHGPTVNNITAVMAANESIPSGYLFCGFDMSIWIGLDANVPKKKVFSITNVRVHDVNSVKRWHQLGGRYGDENYLGNHQSVIPHLKSRSNSSRSSPWQIQLN